MTRTVAAPAGLGIDINGVPEGSDVHLELRLEAVMDGVLATGTASMHVSGECVRCLEPVEDDLVVDLQELYLYEGAGEDEAQLDDDLLDLEPLLRDEVVLAVEQNPLCGPDCPGLCVECGARLADDPDHTHGEQIDPRWAALAQLTDVTQTDDDQSDAAPATDRPEE